MTTPAWVRESDGTLVPFDPDAISRALFAAGESLGRPDAFLARELADGVVHFLASESDESTLSTAQVAETVVKVVRELGHPALAQTLADGFLARARQGRSTDALPRKREPSKLVIPFAPDATRGGLTAACMSAYALEAVFARDLAAAHRGGLLTLEGLEEPFRLAACVLEPAVSVLEAVEEARRQTSGYVVIDGPEYALASRPEAVSAYARELRAALRCADASAVVNLNCTTASSSADEVVFGPLFEGRGPPAAASRLEAVADSLLDELSPPATGAASPVRVDWHLGEGDFRPEAESRLVGMVRRAIDGAPLAFTFDRPRQPITLAAGLDRQNPAVLLMVQLHLPMLAVQVSGHADAPARFLHALGTLARLALSAGVQKREFLRRRSAGRPELARGFLLDRARLIVAPVGLHAVVATLLGQSPQDSPEALELARRIVERLRDVVSEDARTRHLEVGLDGSLLDCGPKAITPALKPADVETQLRVAAALHAAAPLGSFSLQLGAELPNTPREIFEALHWLWKRSAVARIQLGRNAPPARQLALTLES
jgi:hypothetical protein